METYANKSSENKVGSKLTLRGLVLAGGKSSRMGQDKGLMDWYGKPQRYYAADLLSPFCDETYISCRPDQVGSMDSRYKLQVDTEAETGQFGAIMLALSKQEGAWLVLACDLPLVSAPSLEYLVSERDSGKLATAFAGEKGLPEPLVAIWESTSYSELLRLRTEGVTCPRKALIRLADKVKLVEPPSRYITMNVNTPSDVEIARRRINQAQELSR